MEISDNSSMQNVISEAKKLEKAGHEITLELTGDDLDLNQIPDEFRKIDKREIDIMNRGVSLDMSEYDRLKEYMKIKEVNENDMDMYINIAKEIIGESANEQ